MKFGICTDLIWAESVKSAGYDYIELKAYDVAGWTKEEAENVKHWLKQIKLPCEAINFFYPPSLSVIGSDICRSEIYSYIERVMGLAEKLQIQMITIGSSQSRRIPEGFSEEAAKEQFADQLYWIGEKARSFGAVAAIEPIRPSSTNFVNTIGEAVEICEMVGHPSVKVMADYYQMYGAKDPISEIQRYGDQICHLHTIELEHHVYPTDPKDKGQIRLFQAYRGARVSIEGADFTSEKRAKEALNALKSYEKNALIRDKR